MFVEEEDGRVALTPIGERLRTGVPGSVRAGALLFSGRTQDAWSDLMYNEATGFRLTRIIPTPVRIGVIEGEPV